MKPETITGHFRSSAHGLVRSAAQLLFLNYADNEAVTLSCFRNLALCIPVMQKIFSPDTVSAMPKTAMSSHSRTSPHQWK